VAQLMGVLPGEKRQPVRIVLEKKVFVIPLSR
jgi:hypothetical protein